MSGASLRVAILGAAGMAVCGAAGSAWAQWTATVLSPDGTYISHAFYTSGGRQAGWVRASDGSAHASLWSGSAASWVDLHPAGALSSSVAALDGNQQAGNVSLPPTWNISPRAVVWSGSAASMVDLTPTGATGSVLSHARGGQQVGYAWVPPASGGGAHIKRASLWSGTAASWVDLHPPATESSIAFALSGGQQVGIAVVAGQEHASVWSGSAATWVDLHPAGATTSRAYVIDGAMQAGKAVVDGREHAGVWSGTAASWVDLHPADGFQSGVSAAVGGRQGGSASFPGFVSPPFPPFVSRASLWSGTSASRVDLHPEGAVNSAVAAMHGEYQVGYATFRQPSTANPSPAHAGVWMGSAGSWVDLSKFLPTYGGSTEAWYETYATSVWSDGLTLYVSGYGENFADPETHALLWTRPLCGTADFNGDGDFGTDQDIEAFFACLGGQCCAACFARGSDFNGDGDFGTDQDIEAFFRVLGGGAC
jgi:hypothetical protein